MKNLLRCALLEDDLKKYLPNFPESGKDLNEASGATINKKFLFNVIATVKPDFWTHHIKEAMKQRRQKIVAEEMKYVELKTEFFDLIVNSEHTSSSKSRVYKFLQT